MDILFAGAGCLEIKGATCDSFSPLFPSRFEMRFSNSAKKLSLDGSICLVDTYPVDITSIFYTISVRLLECLTPIMWKM